MGVLIRPRFGQPCFDCGEPISTQRIQALQRRRKPAAPLAEIGPGVRRVREQARDVREGAAERMVLSSTCLRAAHGLIGFCVLEPSLQGRHAPRAWHAEFG